MSAAATNPALPRAQTPLSIIERWRSEGPLVRVPTGIAALDEACRGGLPIPWRMMVVGSPVAGKTGCAVIIADHMAREAAERLAAVRPVARRRHGAHTVGATASRCSG